MRFQTMEIGTGMGAVTEPRKMYRLNANKTKFYNLAKRYYPDIEPMRKTRFIKYPRVRDYALEFWSGNYHHRLLLSVCGGKVCLGDDYYAYDKKGASFASGRSSSWEGHSLEMKELLEFGLLEASG